MQEKPVQSKTKFIIVAICVLLFTLSLAIISIAQIVHINKLNKEIAQQERQIDDLNKELSD